MTKKRKMNEKETIPVKGKKTDMDALWEGLKADEMGGFEPLKSAHRAVIGSLQSTKAHAFVNINKKAEEIKVWADFGFNKRLEIVGIIDPYIEWVKEYMLTDDRLTEEYERFISSYEDYLKGIKPEDEMLQAKQDIIDSKDGQIDELKNERDELKETVKAREKIISDQNNTMRDLRLELSKAGIGKRLCTECGKDISDMDARAKRCRECAKKIQEKQVKKGVIRYQEKKKKEKEIQKKESQENA